MPQSNRDNCQQWLANHPSKIQCGEKLMLVEGYLEKTCSTHPKYDDYQATHKLLSDYISATFAGEDATAVDEPPISSAKTAVAVNLSGLASDEDDITTFDSQEDKRKAFNAMRSQIGISLPSRVSG